MKPLLAAVSLLMFVNVCLAETPAPLITAKQSTTPSIRFQKPVKDELILFELEMAENGYELSKGLESRTRLLSIYEKILDRRCLSSTRATLAPSGPHGDDVCIEYANRALKLDSGDVVAICVLNGIDSALCKSASESQKLGTYDPIAEEKNQTAALDDVIASKRDKTKIDQQTNSLMNKIKYLKVDSKKGSDALQQKKALMKQVLDLNCVRSRIKLTEGKQIVSAEPTKIAGFIPQDDEQSETTKDKPKSLEGPFSELLNEHFKTPTPVVTAPESRRTYEVSVRCNKYLEEAFKLDPNLPEAHCHKWGFYSWQCVNAKRLEKRKNPAPGKTGSSMPTGNIQSF